MPRTLLLSSALLVLVSGVRAQTVAAPLPRARGAEAPAVVTALEAGDRARDAGRTGDAVRHYLRALEDAPFSTAVLARLVAAAGDDEDARRLWCHRYAAAAADGRGAFRVPGAERRHWPRKDRHPKLVARARAAAARGLASYVKRLRPRAPARPSDALVARFAAVVALELLGPSPALLEQHAGVFNEATEPFVPDVGPLVAGLKSLMDQASARDDLAAAVRIARCINGFATQAGFDDLKGPEPPDLKKLRVATGAAVRKLRERMREARSGDGQETLPALQELEALDAAGREAFNREHSSMGNPGVCRSPGGLYRVETSCGVATLIGAARTVERHHRRLADWYGEDPFEDRPGVVRIVPDGDDLEEEGTPYWWAGGFQSGDVTTVRFNTGTIEGLGRLLTHELTHRFDGALLPGMPAWLVEGRAVWTGAAYAHSTSEEFADDHVRFGTMEGAFIKGYGGLANLKKLIEGTIDDYRDNYVAGYALFVYLSTFPVGRKPLYAGRLREYMEGFAGRRGKPLETFARHFCDGREGRPEDLEAFAKAFREYLQGFHWQSRAEWTKRYTRKLEGPDLPDPYVYDGRTWVWSRVRSEPWFGQDQARTAGDLLLAGGRSELARDAWCWALLVDEWTPAFAADAARLLSELGDARGAWVVAAEAHRRFPRRAPPPEGPFPDGLARTRALLEALAEAAAEYREAGHTVAAAALAADHDRLAGLIGRPPLDVPVGAAALGKLRHPFNGPAFSLGAYPFVETDLHGYEERRVRGLWYVTGDGDVHVGRRKPKEGTGTTDRYAHQRHAFTRSELWLPRGRFVLRTRIHPTTSFVSGAIVLGFTRRDRNVRFRFSAGDWLYSVGAKDEATKLESARCSIAGLRTRDGATWSAVPRKTVGFPHPVTSFPVELLVDGAHVHAFVGDEFIGSYHTPDAQPVEGYVGFAAGQGAYRAQAPVVLPLDRHPDAGWGRPWPHGLDVDRPQDAALHRLLNRATSGLPVEPTGTLVVWVPKMPAIDLSSDFDAERTADYAFRFPVTLARLLRREPVAPPFVLAVPRDLGEEALARLRKVAAAADVPRLRVVTHAWPPRVDREARDPRKRFPQPRLLFVDAYGILRTVHQFTPGLPAIPPAVRHWARIFHQEPLAAGNGGTGDGPK